ncbi:SDR family NAD(P)-dependent oxidoreductase [Maricurvus nonylphenolicus]|uniref:oxidoreductase n=1 Tax=Maricurvus nonylphenolicus TaxID=1008307 RepID=UPI0036F281A4
MSGFTHHDVPDQTGKVFFITGANTGIGFEAAKVLAGRNARVLIGCRNPQKAQAAIASIRESNPNADLDIVPLDLSDLESVKQAAAIVNQETRLDVLINNAGIMVPPLEYTAQGIESQLGVNHIGPFTLTCLLLDKLEATPGSRIVNTTSLAARYGRIHFDDINAEQGYDTNARYSQSKLANLLFSFELQRRLQNKGSKVISIACHPGIADTKLSRHMSGLFRFFTPLVRLLCNTPLQGAWPTLQAATAPELTGGELCGPGKRKQTAGPAKTYQLNSIANDKPTALALWNKSIELSGVNANL